MSLVLESPPIHPLPAEDEALRAEIKAFIAETLDGVPSSARARSWMGFDAEFSRKLGERGWIGLTLPKEYGGSERGAFARFVLSEELLASGAPVAAHWIADRQSGPLILRFGTETQRQFYIPRICRGEAFFCIGMSEPNSGSDLASVRTTAVQNADGWKLNGSKIWTTNGHRSHYMIALVRTSGTPADRNAGLSQFIIDLQAPGVTRRPIMDLAGDAHFSEIHFDDVQLGPDTLVGEEGAGWEQVNAELAFERSGPERIYSSMALTDAWIAWLQARGDVTESETLLAGQISARLAVLRSMSLALTERLSRHESPVIEAALLKDLGTSYEQSIPALVGEMVAAAVDADVPADLLATLDYVTAISPSYSLRGGTREILRGIIARGLGLR
ncbi:MAG: acyl-CoA dehydrogenase family protein [Phenylobacterium sp.]|uniref:acyl-CoA dehydrogenase family protein n=1 Tax=Phenylobacterium sp. TaxID=1871053 RepID=UPI002735E26E|nr:acyl-CoA dehydrogenase family protein [Phenylobacterium sp.]MDP3173821.1 acyl-CoA dehydrogenase family protein [Phenylobacterium sp.]